MSKTFLRRPRADCTRVLGTIWNEVFDNYLARIIYSIYPLPWWKSMDLQSTNYELQIWFHIVAVESVVSASQSGQEGPRQMTFTLLLPIGCQKKARRWSRKIFIEMRSSSAHIKAFSSESGLIVRNIFLILLQLYSQIWWSIWHAHSLFNAW